MDYVIVKRDGTIDVRSLTTAQAASLAADPDIRTLSPDRTLTVSESPTEIMTGLDFDENELSDGDIIATSCNSPHLLRREWRLQMFHLALLQCSREQSTVLWQSCHQMK